MNDYLVSVDEAVLSAESNPARFERFCNELVSGVEGGVAVVNTSVVWDRGRDGRGVGQAVGVFVCCSLRDDVDAKVIEDIERLVQTTKGVRTLYFCSSKSLSEHRCDQISAAIGEYLPAASIVVLGAAQLAQLGRSAGGALEKIYGSEIKDVLARLSGSPDDKEEVQSLRLALLSTGAEDSVAIRSSVYRNALLEVLSDRVAKTAEKLAVDLSGLLRLGRPLDPVCLTPYLLDLERDGYIERPSAKLFVVNDAGVAQLDATRAAGASSLLEGRRAIRRILEDAVGSPILDDDFQRIWSSFEDRLAYYLQSRGEQIVSEVMSLFGEDGDVDGGNGSDEVSPQLSFLEELASHVAATVRHAERQEVVRQSIKDLFSDRCGDAAKWLVSVCAAFIAACTIGLEYRTGEVVRALMRRISIVLDTDVVLSLLGEGEPEHDAVSAIVRRWRENKGKVLVGTPVLQEVAYHASIAGNDFEQVKFKLPGDENYRLRVIDNAFVRSFADLMSRDPAIKLNHWRSYISQFRGSHDYDVARVGAYLASEYGIERLPDRDAARSADVESVKAFIISLLEVLKLRIGRNERDKSARDADLYVSLVSHAAQMRAADPDAGCLLVSSSRRLSAVDEKFGMSGESRLVISISSALYLVSTLPTVSLGLSALKSFLFDDRKIRFSSDFERTVLRMVSSSKEHSAFVFSRRGLLVREVKERLVSRAEIVGGGIDRRDMAEVERTALLDENRESFVLALAQSLDAVSANGRTDMRLKAALAELEEVKRQLEIEKGRRKQ